MVNYVLLLPPSEGKNVGGDKSYLEIKDKKEHNYFKELEEHRFFIINRLREFLERDNRLSQEKVLKVKGNNFEDSKNHNLTILNSPCIEAINRFSGVMFKSISYDSLNKDNFDESVIFVDAVFGLLKPLDLIPNYKLMMGSNFLDVKTVKFWNNNLKSILSREFEDKFVIDLLPNIHREVIDYDDIVSVYFFEGDKNVGHKSKKLKGEFVKFVCDNEFVDLDVLKSFEHSEGYLFCENSSTNNKIIYKKK